MVDEFWKRVNTSDVSEYSGDPSVGPSDERESRAFIVELRHKRWILPQKSDRLPIRTRVARALDCGAGNGRVTQNVLLRAFDEVDLVELAAPTLAVALRNIAATANDSRRVGVLGRAFNVPLQKFEPEKGREYDVVWLQFVTGYLVDADFDTLLRRLRSTLTHQSQSTNEKANGDEAAGEAVSSGGLIVIKDNVHFLDGPDVKPTCEPESHMTVRSRTHMHRIFESAGLKILLERKITANYLPVSVCCPVWLFVLR